MNIIKLLFNRVIFIFKLLLLLKLRIGFLWRGWRYKRQYPLGTLSFITPTEEEFKAKGTINGADIALFLVWGPRHRVMYQRYFDLLERLGFKVIVVLNGGKVSDEFLTYFKQRALAIITRDNIGRDFGAYKECIQYFQRNDLQPRRLLICNDSVFADLMPNDNRFEEFVHQNANKDFVGVAEYMGKPNYHVQSYFLIFSNKVLNAPSFREFWEKFLITDDRRLNIHKGEVALSQAIIKGGFSPTVFLSTDRVLSSISLSNNNAQDLLLDTPPNMHVFVSSAAKIDKLRQLQHSYIELTKLENQSLEEGDNFSPATVDAVQKQKFLLDKEFISTLAPVINIHGMITTAPFAIVRIYGFPFLKRDLVYRQVAEWMLIRDRCEGFDDALLDEYIEDQRLRKRHWHLKSGNEKWMYDTGMN